MEGSNWPYAHNWAVDQSNRQLYGYNNLSFQQNVVSNEWFYSLLDSWELGHLKTKFNSN